jgi:hypothetical protein
MQEPKMFINTVVPVETEKALSIIAKEMGVNRSVVVRWAITEYLKSYENSMKVTRLPGPDDGEVIPVVEVKDIRYPMRSE